MTRRPRPGAALLVALLAAGVLGCTPVGDDRVDVDAAIAAHVASLSPDGPYRDPDRAEREATRAALDVLLTRSGDAGRADELLRGIGFRVVRGVDAADGRPMILYLADPATGWGGLLIDPSAPVRSVIGVPHPAHDLHTEELGLRLYRAAAGSALLIAGAHRRAADEDADVAHNDRSLFHLISEEAAERRIPQLQLHGFGERSLPGADAVVSTGSGPRNDLAIGIARELKARDLTVCRAWVSRCTGLEGVTNVQGAAAEEHDADFVHLELGWSLRRDTDGREQAGEAISAAWPTQG